MSRNKRNWDQLVDRTGNYGIDISRGLWPGSELDSKGEAGKKGEPGDKGDRGIRGRDGLQGEKGFQGDQGEQGEDGKSAYELALENGFTGSEAEWLASLEGIQGDKGDRGYSNYDLWLLSGNAGTEQDYRDSLKGDQGDQGQQGEKGDQGGLFEFSGQLPNYDAIINSPGPYEKGEVIQDAETEDLWVWDGTQWVLLTEAVSVLKGEAGETGPRGEKGDRGDTQYESAVKGGLFSGTEEEWIASFKGDQGEQGDQGNTGLTGDTGPDGKSAYDIAVEQGFVGTEPEWIASLNGSDGDDGDSAYDIYKKGVTDPNDLLSEPEWIDSLKGDKGEAGTDIDTSKYYTKSEVNQIIEITTPPERSYVFDEMSDPFVVEAGDVVDFRDNNQQLPIYNPGLVQVRNGAVVDNVPLVPPFFLRNTVISSLMSPRGVDHTVLQEIFSAIPDRSETWFRIAQPGTNTFGDWDSGGGFDPNDYYTKSQVSMLVNGQVFYLEARGTDISLRDKIGSDAGTIPLVGSNGISITNDGNGTIKIDGSSLLNEEKLFLGILEDGEDPTTKFPDAKTGNFFVFAYEGDAPAEFDDGAGNVPTVKGGDLAYYDEGPPEVWNFVESSAGGLLDVNVPVDGLLEVDKTDPKKPVIELDPDKVVTPDELDPYVTYPALAQLSSERLIGSLKDVNISYTPTTFAGQLFNKVEFSSKLPLDELPDGTPGVYGVDPDSNTLLLAKRDKDGNQVADILYNNIDINADPKQKIRVRTSAGVSAGSDGMIGYVTAKATRTNHYEITFDNPAVPLAALQASDLVLDIVTEDTANGDILAYDSNTEMWEPKEGGFVKKSGDTMTGNLTIKNTTDGNSKLVFGPGTNAGIWQDGVEKISWYGTRGYFEGSYEFTEVGGKDSYFILYDAPKAVDCEIDYVGKISGPNNITTKKYVDDKIAREINFNNYPELT